MSWQTLSAHWPESAANISAAAADVVGQLPQALDATTARLDSISERVNYAQHPLSAAAAQADVLQQQVQQLLINGQHLIAANGMFRRQAVGPLSARTALDNLAAQCRDEADKRRLTGTVYAQVWLWSNGTPQGLLAAISPIANWMTLPKLSAFTRRLAASIDLASKKMQQPATPGANHFPSAGIMLPHPINGWHANINATLAQLASISSDRITPVDRLKALAQKRTEHLQQLEQQLAALQAVAGSVYGMSFNGSMAQLAQALTGDAPLNQQYSAAVLLLSDKPMTLLQELFT